MRENKIVKIIRICAVALLWFLVLYVVVVMARHPELASADAITHMVSENKGVAMLEFWMLYLLKGVSFVFPSAPINVAAGAVFGFPVSLLVSASGIFFEFIAVFLVGRTMGEEVVEWTINKYPKLERLRQLNIKSGFGISFVIRIMGIISYDIGSLYLGATGVRWDKFILGSMLGAVFNILLANLFGQYMFNPFCWQLWAIVAIRILAIALVYIVWKIFFGDKKVVEHN